MVKNGQGLKWAKDCIIILDERMSYDVKTSK